MARWHCNGTGDASYDVYLSVQDGRSPLMVASSKGNVKCLQLLLEKGAHVNHQDKVSSFHHEMRSLPLVHVYHVPLYEWSISSKVSLISPPSFHPQRKKWVMHESPYLFDYDHFHKSFSHVRVPFYFHAY